MRKRALHDLVDHSFPSGFRDVDGSWVNESILSRNETLHPKNPAKAQSRHRNLSAKREWRYEAVGLLRVLNDDKLLRLRLTPGELAVLNVVKRFRADTYHERIGYLPERQRQIIVLRPLPPWERQRGLQMSQREVGELLGISEAVVGKQERAAWDRLLCRSKRTWHDYISRQTGISTQIVSRHLSSLYAKVKALVPEEERHDR